MSKRLKPPDGLSEGAKVEFIRIVTCEKSDHFRTSDLSMLVQFCEAAALAERAMKEMQGDGAPERWLTVWEKSARMMKDLALRLAFKLTLRQRINSTRALRVDANEATNFPLGDR